MSLVSRVQVGGVDIDGLATLSVQTRTESAGGSYNLRMADGSIVRQIVWQKSRVTLTCRGWIPPALGLVDWTQQIVVQVEALNGGFRSWTGYADPPQQTTTAADQADCEWTLTLEET